MIARCRPIRIRPRTSRSSRLRRNFWLQLSAILLTTPALLALPQPALAVVGVANITLSSNAFTFNALDSTQLHMPSTPITVHGTMVTDVLGSGSIALLSPANITGSAGGLLRISYLSMTCSGPSAAGQTFVATLAQLASSSSVPCATYGANFNSVLLPGATLNFNLALFLDDRTLDNDRYPSTNFTVVATAI